MSRSTEQELEWFKTIKSMGMSSRFAWNVYNAWGTREELLDQFESEIPLTDAKGIGESTSRKLRKWVKENHPEVIDND